jgi:hypothetical protein
LSLNPSGNDSELNLDRLESHLKAIKKNKNKIYFVEFEDLFEYLFISFKLIEQVQRLIKKVKATTKIEIKSCFIFAAAVSDFYIPLKEMVGLSPKIDLNKLFRLSIKFKVGRMTT